MNEPDQQTNSHDHTSFTPVRAQRANSSTVHAYPRVQREREATILVDNDIEAESTADHHIDQQMGIIENTPTDKRECRGSDA